jgi:hypothetical protein
MYELGLAHGLEKPVIIITQSLEELPFDLRAYRAIQYDVHFSRIGQLVIALQKCAYGFNDRSVSFSNPVTDFKPSAELPEVAYDLDSHEASASPSESLTTDETEELEPGFLDLQIMFDAAMEELTSCTQRVGEIARRSTDSMQSNLHDIEDAKKSQAPGVTLRLHQIAGSLSRELIEHATEMGALPARFRAAWSAFDSGSSRLFERVPVSNAEELKAANDFVVVIGEVIDNHRGLVQAMQSSASGTHAMRGISTDLNRASIIYERVLQTVKAEINSGEASLERLRTLIQTKIAAFGS